MKKKVAWLTHIFTKTTYIVHELAFEYTFIYIYIYIIYK